MMRSFYFLIFLLCVHFGMLYFFFFPDNLSVTHDNLNNHYAYFSFILSSLYHFDEWPFWNPYLNHGIPTFVYLHNWFLLAITRMPFYFIAKFSLWPLNTSLLYKLNLFLNVIFFSFFLWLLFKQIFKTEKAICWGLLLATLGGLSIANYSYEQIAISGLYIPLILFLFIRFYKSYQKIYLFILSFFMGHALCNHYPHLIVYSLTTFVVIACLFFFKEVKIFARKMLSDKTGLVIFIFGLGLGCLPLIYNLFFYLPHLTSPSRGNSQTASWEWLSGPGLNNSLDPKALITLLNPWFGLVPLSTRVLFLEKVILVVGYMGGLCLILSVFKHKKNKKFLFWLGCFFIFCLLSMGPFGGLYNILYKVSSLARYHRLPAQFVIFLALCSVIVSSYIFENNWKKKWMLVIFLISILDLLNLFKYSMTRLSEINSIEKTVLNLEKPQYSVTEGFNNPYKKLLHPNNSLLTFKHLKQNHSPTGAAEVPSGNTLTLSSYTYNRIQLEVDNKESIELSLHYNYDPRWKVWIDGHLHPPIQTSTGEMNLMIPAHSKKIIWVFHPAVEKIILVSHVSFLLITFLILIMIKFIQIVKKI